MCIKLCQSRDRLRVNVLCAVKIIDRNNCYKINNSISLKENQMPCRQMVENCKKNNLAIGVVDNSNISLTQPKMRFMEL